MANTHNSKAILGQKSEKIEGKKVVPVALAGIRTRVAGSKVGRSATELSAQRRNSGKKLRYL